MRWATVVSAWTAGPWSRRLVQLAGLVLLGLAAAAAWLHSANPSFPMTAAVPWSMAALGAAVVGITGFEVKIDGRSRRMTHRWRIGVAVPYATKAVEAYDEVLIRSEWKRRVGSDSPARLSYPVALRSTQRGVERLEILSGPEYELNRAKAVQVALALGLPLRDRPAKLTRAAEELETPLLRRMADATADAAPPPPPTECPIGLERTPDGLGLTIPPAGHPRTSAAFAILPVLVASLLFWRLRGSFERAFSALPEHLAGASIVLAALVASAFGAVTLVRLAGIVLGTRVQVSSSGIWVIQRTVLGPRAWRLDAGRVQDVDLGPLGVAVRGGGRAVILGEGLDEPVAEWLRAVLVRELTSY